MVQCPVKSDPAVFLEAYICLSPEETDQWANSFMSSAPMSIFRMYYCVFLTPHIFLIIWSEDWKDGEALYETLCAAILKP